MVIQDVQSRGAFRSVDASVPVEGLRIPFDGLDRPSTQAKPEYYLAGFHCLPHGRPAVEVLTWRGLATYYVLFFIHLESRRISLVGLTRHPTPEWITQMARNATDENSGFLRGQR